MEIKLFYLFLMGFFGTKFEFHKAEKYIMKKQERHLYVR